MMRLTRTAILMALIAALALTLSACGAKTDKTTGPVISNAWARTSAPKQMTSAIYMTITSDTSDTLTGASVPASIAGTAQLHETVSGAKMGGGSSATGMTMKQVSEIAVTPGAPLVFKPGGYHVMLMELAKPVTVGQKIEFTLTFKKAGQKTATAVAKDVS